MINKISLENFKAFQNMKDLELKNLTVLVGKNSCGKSSIMQSLLLLKQTLDSQSNNSLCMEGRYLKFSNLKELSFGLPSINTAKIGYKFHISSSVDNLSGDVKIGFKNKKNDSIYVPTLSEFTTKLDASDKKKSKKKSFTPMDVNKITKLFRQKYKYIEDDSEGVLVDARILFNKFLPEYLQLEYKKTNKEVETTRKIKFPLFALYDEEMEVNASFNKELKNIRYLSPIRANPQRAYVHYSQDVSMLNDDGSNAAHILWSKRHEKVKWKKQIFPLAKAVNECIKSVGLSQTITPDKIGDILYKVGIKENNTGADVSLADVGFGYSQVIPIILLGLLNSNKNLMLIEQPEIHLHPSSAANLADLFLGFVEDDRRFIIETHSQEFINKLRLRVIQNPELKKKINIVFVEQNESTPSEIKQFEIDEKGMFPEWPQGFIDESEKIARDILQARLGKKRCQE